MCVLAPQGWFCNQNHLRIGGLEIINLTAIFIDRADGFPVCRIVHPKPTLDFSPQGFVDMVATVPVFNTC